MKYLILLGWFCLLYASSIAQKMDLIVSLENDSIACKIDSITENYIYFSAKLDRKKLNTHISLDQVAFYELNSIDINNTKSIPGTIYFNLIPENTQKLARNAVYGSLGTGLFFFSGTGFYEQILTKNTAHKKVLSFVKGGFGGYANRKGWTYLMLQYGILTGSSANHLELGAGLVYYFIGDSPLSGTIGYRYQKPGGDFIFRTGISRPEVLYVSIGVAF
ncbi:MAG: hypothetical protein ACP5E3_01375 [Bacteroidales bacterium]